MREATATLLGALIGDLARSLTASAPAPRALPYFGLEQPSGTAVELLDALSGHGIFRKYELVLDLGGGLGGLARWLVSRLGCTAVATAASAAEAEAGALLTRRARLRGRVHHLPSAAALPVRDARFTHVWAVETLPRMPHAAAALAEAFRALRPGGHLAVQDLVRREPAVPPRLAGWHFVTPATRVGALRQAGFVDITLRDVTTDAAERAARIVAAREQLDRLLAIGGAELAAVAAERAALADARVRGRIGVVQIVARRP